MIKLSAKEVDQKVARIKQSNNSNGNGKRQPPRPESSCSEDSSHSGSCSCEDHSSVASRSPSPENASQGSYQSFTRSPSLKIKIHKDSNSRTVKNLKSPPRKIDFDRKRKHQDYPEREARPKKSRNSSKKRDYQSLLKYFFKDSVYFVMKSNNPENVHISKREGVWATPGPNENKLNSAFKEFRNVILIFSVKESGKFQGFARLSSEANFDCEPVKWVLPPGVNSCPFRGLFYVDWICRNELSFNLTTHLYNPFNEDKPVKIARDGQEIDPRIGEELCRLFASDDSVDLIPLLKRMKKQTQHRAKKRHSRGPFMDYDKFDSPRSDYRLRPSYSSSVQMPPVKKRLGDSAIPYREHSSRHSREDRTSSSDRSRIASRREHISNGDHRSYQSNSTDHNYDSYRRTYSRSQQSSYSRSDRRPREYRS